jgi:hypothetical protein
MEPSGVRAASTLDRPWPGWLMPLLRDFYRWMTSDSDFNSRATVAPSQDRVNAGCAALDPIGGSERLIDWIAIAPRCITEPSVRIESLQRKESM